MFWKKLLFLFCWSFFLFGQSNFVMAHKSSQLKTLKKHIHKTPKDSLFDIDPTIFNQDFSTYHQESAMMCSVLSEFSYLRPGKAKRIIKKIQARYPEQKIQYEFIEVKKSGTELIFFGTKDYMIIAFRGTEILQLRDLITDSKIKVYENTQEQKDKQMVLAGGPAGFRRSMFYLLEDDLIFNKIHEFIDCIGSKFESTFPIYLTGHSLGAALASHFILPLTSNNYNFQGAYLFAPPLAISKNDAKFIQKKYGHLIHEIVNYRDYVSRATKYHRNRLAHIGTFYRIHKNGEIRQEEEEYISFRTKERHLLIKYHRLINYIRHLHKKKNSTQLVKKRSTKQFYLKI